jgi:DNA-binding transcriptional LysR family regulator
VTNFRNFDLNLLLVLDGVLREGTLSNAAKALSVSQPTISSSLAKLREILQDELFVRSGNGMQPTPRALALKEPVQRLLAAVKGEILDTGKIRSRHGNSALHDRDCGRWRNGASPARGRQAGAGCAQGKPSLYGSGTPAP